MQPEALPPVLGGTAAAGSKEERLEDLLDWAESLADCLMQGFVGEEWAG